MPSPRRVALRLSLAGVVIAALSAFALQAPAVAAQPAFPNGAPAEAPDYATTTFGDAWDFSNSQDLKLQVCADPSALPGSMSHTAQPVLEPMP